LCALSALLLGGAVSLALADNSPPAAVPAAAPAMIAEKNLCSSSAGPVALGSVQWNGWGRDQTIRDTNRNRRYAPMT
jgi:hypothetical protein